MFNLIIIGLSVNSNYGLCATSTALNWYNIKQDIHIEILERVLKTNERELDSFDRALQAEATMYESKIKLLTEGEDQDFRKVDHDECIYRLAVLFLQVATNSPRNILTPVVTVFH